MTNRPRSDSQVETERLERKRRVEKRIENARKPGQELNDTEKAMLALFASIDPKYEPHYRDQLMTITRDLSWRGKWEESDEWRISTYYDSRIEKIERGGDVRYVASVSCDGQVLSCECVLIERAFACVLWYRHMIVYQFYSVGPPWSKTSPFEQ